MPENISQMRKKPPDPGNGEGVQSDGVGPVMAAEEVMGPAQMQGVGDQAHGAEPVASPLRHRQQLAALRSELLERAGVAGAAARGRRGLRPGGRWPRTGRASSCCWPW